MRRKIDQIAAESAPNLIGEEAKLDKDCIGKIISDLHHSRYCNLTMPWAEREKFGIDKNYDKSRESRSRAYSLFEDFMFEQVQTNRLDDDNILIICGSYHVRGLASRFKQAGDDVVTEDTYDANWYRGIPLEVDGGIDGFYKEVHGRDD